MGLVFKQASQSGITAPDYGTAIRNITEQLKARKLKSLDKELGDYFTSTALYEGGLSVVDGGLVFNSTSQLPTFNEAWASYKDIYEKNGQTAGMNAYQQFKNVYADNWPY